MEKSFRTSLDSESGLVILICEILALILADNLQLGKPSTNWFCAPKRNPRLFQFQPLGLLPRKSQKQLIPATQNRFSGGTFIASECTIYYLFFFCYLFRDPPGGYLKQKKSFTLLHP